MGNECSAGLPAGCRAGLQTRTCLKTKSRPKVRTPRASAEPPSSLSFANGPIFFAQLRERWAANVAPASRPAVVRVSRPAHALRPRAAPRSEPQELPPNPHRASPSRRAHFFYAALQSFFPFWRTMASECPSERPLEVQRALWRRLAMSRKLTKSVNFARKMGPNLPKSLSPWSLVPQSLSPLVPGPLVPQSLFPALPLDAPPQSPQNKGATPLSAPGIF
jgi:hypothetical protein